MRAGCVLALALASLVACGGDGSAPVAVDAGVDGPPPFLAAPPEGQGRQVTLPPFTIAAGQEAYWCYTLPFPESAQVDLARIESRFSLGAHHLLLSTVEGNFATGSGPCGPSDFGYHVTIASAYTGNLRFLSGAQTPYSTDPRAELRLEDGMAFRVRPNTKLLAQLHWANTTEAPMTAETAINLWWATTPPTKLLEAFFFYHTGFSIPPHSTVDVAGRCTFPLDAEVVGMVSHMHARGTRLTARRWDGGLGAQVYEESSWQEPQMKMWPGAGLLNIASGTGLEYRCTFTNPGAGTIVEGEGAGDEMCMLIGLYAGGTRTLFGFPGLSGVPNNPCIDVP